MRLRNMIGCLTALVSLFICCSTVPAASFTGLGVQHFVEGISGDGSVAVGWGTRSSSDALRWTNDGDLLNLGDLDGFCCSKAVRASFDGTVVVGESLTPSSEDIKAFFWDEAHGMVALGTLPGMTRSTAQDVSADGTVVVGSSFTPGSEAFLWTESGGMVGLGVLAGYDASDAVGISADGSVVVGGSYNDTLGFAQAFRWTSAGGMQGLGALPGAIGGSQAVGISADGTTVVGYSNSTNGYQAFRWTETGGMVGLGDLPGGGFHSEAGAVSGDGLVVVGWSTIGNSYPSDEAFIWDEVNGMRPVADVLTDLGLDLTGWHLRFAKGISDDGNVIGGWGVNPDGQEQAWIARLTTVPEPTTATYLIFVTAIVLFLRKSQA